MEVEWHDLRYWVKTGKRNRESKTLLHGISGNVKPGEILAVMGPSGGGKTSLLNLLAGRSTNGYFSGERFYAGIPFGKNTKRRLGFVTQDDLMFGNLTVLETLMFTANLKLPSKVSRDEKMKKIRQVMKNLKLGDVEDTLIGDGLHRKGVSGGERKRVAIANEILVDPSVIFLDEPTSGLDSSTALHIMQTLKELAQSGKTIIMSIHQPASQIYGLFDKLMLLREGRTVFFGPRKDAVDFFGAAGFQCPFGYNPADYFMGLISDVDGSDALETSPEKVVAKLEATWQLNPELNLEEGYEPTASAVEASKLGAKYAVSWWTQLTTLCGRSVRQRRGTIIEEVSLIKYLTTTFLFAVVWFRTEMNETDLYSRIGLLYFIVVFWALSSVLQTAGTFASEISIVKKERAGSAYRLSAYFVAKSIIDIPYDIIYPVIFGIIVYWTTGLDPNPGKFFIFMAVLLSHTINAYSWGLVASTATMNIRKSLVLASVYTLASVLFAGFYANSNNLGPVAKSLQYVSFIRYAYSALVINETNGSQYECVDPPTAYREFGCPIEQNAVLAVDPMVEIGVAGNLAAIWGFIILFRLVSYTFLRLRSSS